MRPTDTVAVRCRADFRTRREWYRTLARAVVATPAPAGVVLEASATDPRPWALLRPARRLDDLAAAGRAGAEPIDVRPAPRAPRPPPGSYVRFGFLTPHGSDDPPSAPSVPLAAPSLTEIVGPSGWLAVQTFWLAGPRGGLWVARRFGYAAPSRRERDARFDAVAGALAYDGSLVTGEPTTGHRSGPVSAGRWRRRSIRGFPRAAWRLRDPEVVASTAEVRWLGSPPTGGPPAGHAVVFGASGAGKTTYLAHRAAQAVARGERVVAIDLHGDLGPALLARLPDGARQRVLAVDASSSPVPGVAALLGGADDRAAALFVAAVKRLSADGTDVYWGFRLERIFDSFVRLVQESGGSLLDLYDLLTSADRRDAARLATRRPELARFLEELEPIVRRTPDFLWSAATRLSKVVLVPALAELLAPADGGLPVETRVAEGRSLVVRIPIARLGPEAAALAGTLVLARVFLGLAGHTGRDRVAAPVLVLLDEVQGFSPRLVAELLAESRKFGLRAIVATQYPERLAPELRSAAAGAAAEFVAFRVPPPSAAEAGAWLGLDRLAAERLLPALPTGRAVGLDPETGALLPLGPAPPGSDAGAAAGWAEAVARTRQEHAPAPAPGPAETFDDPAAERILLAVLAAEEEGTPLDDARAVSAAVGLPGRPLDPALLSDRWVALRHRGWVAESDGRYYLAPGGARWLGLGAPTGAARETSEHRRLIVRAFRVFARRGYRIEVVRQGRFDTTLPDARFRQLRFGADASVPVDLAREIDRARGGWAWRFFGGRDVHVEAEVSGALRAERIRLGVAKATARGAYVLFVVGDAAHARRVRRTLEREGVGRDLAQVWTFATGAGPKP
ncbi:MAG: hypothetical protein ACRECT_08940 [Thermoplasmata archaeon]